MSISYRSILRDAYTVVDSISADAELSDLDLVVLHVEPRDYESIYRQFPTLKTKYVVSYAIWEASLLPEKYIDSLRHVQEVWTCSKYSKAVIEKHHPCVVLIPPVVERELSYTPDALEEAKRLMNYEKNAFYFLAMGSFKDPRKNLKFLVRVFFEAMSEMPNSHLVIKADKNDEPIVHPSGRVHVIPAQLSSEVINALYQLSHAFVSVHHSEGWGLGISDAMLFRLPVVATGYSGNLDFMSDANSFLVASSERHIASKDCFGLFTAQMKWAYPSSDSLIQKLKFVYHYYRQPEVQNRITYAAASIKRFSRARVSDLVKSRVLAITSKVHRVELKTGMHGPDSIAPANDGSCLSTHATRVSFISYCKAIEPASPSCQLSRCA